MKVTETHIEDRFKSDNNCVTGKFEVCLLCITKEEGINKNTVKTPGKAGASNCKFRIKRNPNFMNALLGCNQ